MSPVQFDSAIQPFEHSAHRAIATGSSRINGAGPQGRIPPTVEFRGTYWLMHRLGNRWTVPIIGALQHGPVRFAQLKRQLGSVSQRMLTLSLRRLQDDGLIYREEISGQPPQVRYGLTPLGEGLVERLQGFESWLTSQGCLPSPAI